MEQYKPAEVDDEQLKTVIADFLDQGHVENIVAMFRREPRYYDWTGELLADQRLTVRLGVAVLFEELSRIQPDQVDLAIPSLLRLLQAGEPLLRGEAVSLLASIGGAGVHDHIRRLAADPSPQVREMVELVLGEVR